jgi:hypothetical protein
VLFIVGNRVRQVRFDSEKLSPEQWDKIAELTGAELTGLPEKAKAQLEDYIGFYRAMRKDSRQYYGNVAKTIQVFKKREEQTLKDLNNLMSMSGRKLLPAIAMGIVHQVPIFDGELELIHGYLKQAAEQKRMLLDWYDKALTRLHRSTTRVPSSLFNLVRLLNSLLHQHTGRYISSGKNDPAFMYVLEVCRSAEPELLKEKNEGYDTIHEVTKRVVTEINEGGSQFAFDMEGWGDLIPYWVERDVLVDDPDWKIKVELHKGTDGSFKLHYEVPKIEGEGSLVILRPLFAPETQC